MKQQIPQLIRGRSGRLSLFIAVIILNVDYKSAVLSRSYGRVFITIFFACSVNISAKADLDLSVAVKRLRTDLLRPKITSQTTK